MNPPKVLLAVLAHPDDETFGTGGTLALYARRGVDVYLVCATRGEVGEADEQAMRSYTSIGAMREAELRCAAGILGLKRVFFLGYRDSGMPNTPPNAHPDAQINHPLDEVAGKVVGYIRSLKPEVVLTFDPIGGYHHPDHIHIQRATTLAFENAGRVDFHPEAGAPFTPRALYYHTMPHRALRLAVFLLRLVGRDPQHFGRNGDIDLASIAAVNFPIHARIDIRPVLEIKDRASACHSSQGGGRMAGGLGGRVMRLFSSSEAYMQAYPQPQRRARLRRDLFLEDRDRAEA
jgi:LmbE family N-acetylglucosaminyl deacetylase